MIGKSPHQQPQVSKPKKSMSTLRLQKDLQALQSLPSYVSISFPNPSDIHQIHAMISLQHQPQIKSTQVPYNHTNITFSMIFPQSYPIDPPKLKCLKKIYHPNINHSGSVCLPLVREDWSPTVALDQIIYGLIFILMYPNGDDALEPEIGDLMKKDYQMFLKIVEYTLQGRMFRNKQYDKVKVDRLQQNLKGTFNKKLSQ